ncbi:ABC transporter ATP-binding protein [Streptomyces sp. NPDC091377]|uniref:ABC transporter ATP-binding protein n=1 Tax=Streptomyces sp. NPDC091377 TaxID=3365995 RepID=UPI00380F1E49
MTGTPYAYEVQNVSKRYEKSSAPVTEDVTFRIREGAFFGLLGGNGAGKTTLIKQMLGLVRPDRGRILLFGRSVLTHPRFTTRTVGYMPQSAFALNSLTVRESLYYTAHLRGLPARAARLERDRLLDLLDLGHLARKAARQLSGGERRLLQLAVTLTGSPPVLVLDEPTNELDPARRRQVWDLLRALHRTDGRTIVLITHNAVEAEQVIEQVGILRDGVLAAVGPPAELKIPLRSHVRLTFSHPQDRPPELPDYVRVRSHHGGRVVAHLASADLARLAVDMDLAALPEFALHTATLEDVYLRHA